MYSLKQRGCLHYAITLHRNAYQILVYKIMTHNNEQHNKSYQQLSRICKHVYQFHTAHSNILLSIHLSTTSFVKVFFVLCILFAFH
jgi:hypothetical protein